MTDGIVNAMSVDVEEYFHANAFDAVVSRPSWERRDTRVRASTERLLDVFDTAGIRATFFIVGWLAERYPGLVRRIAHHGHEIASHSYAHRLVYAMTPDEFREDVRRAKAVLEAVTGMPVLGFRAPSYSITAQSLWALDILIETGHAYDASIFPIHHDRYGIPNAPRHAHVVKRPFGSILEAPASTLRFAGTNLPIAGGGYFRLLPYGWTRRGIARLNRVERKPAYFYVHPWEIDPGQPRLPVGSLTRLRHYRNLAQTEERLVRLMREFRFATMADVLGLTTPFTALPAPSPLAAGWATPLPIAPWQ